MAIETGFVVEHRVMSGNNRERIRVLVCTGYYLPGFKCGGPIRSVANMVTYLSPHFDFYVVTKDRDLADKESYPGITPDSWHRVGSAEVLYSSSVSQATLRRAFREVRPDIIYLNGCWNDFTRLMVILRRFGQFGDTPMLLAPRGDFSLGAMQIKPAKKLLYLHLAKLLGLHENLFWQASTPLEKESLLRAAPARRLNPDSIHVAYNISDAIPSTDPHPEKKSGAVKLAFISRMSKKKNLHFLLDLFSEVRGRVELNLFGPVGDGDADYWESCQAKMTSLPENIRVEYKGSLDHSAVQKALHDHHFFVLPTRGENFCHAAVESFLNGTPVILSDETPWRNLAKASAGFDISLSDRKAWVTALQNCVDMEQSAYSNYLSGAQAFGLRFSVTEAVRQHLAMFEAALEPRKKR